MGVVFEAEHRVMERRVALKVINASLVSNQMAVDRFRNEVRAAAKLSHRNIVTAFDAEQEGNLHFLVMEYVDGVSLDNLVARRGRLPVLHACNYAMQAAQGLQHAFEHGMVHRDIKPQNLMKTPKGLIKILDFGLARLARHSEESSDGSAASAGSLTSHGATLGTPDYIAPEQAKDSRSADIRADIYSLGCTLYFMLAGRVPFPTGTAVEKVVAHCHDDPVELAQLRPDVPAELLAVVRKMMAKQSSERFVQPQEVVDALRPFGRPTDEAAETHADTRSGNQQQGAAAGNAAVETREFDGGAGRDMEPAEMSSASSDAPLNAALPVADLSDLSSLEPAAKRLSAPPKSKSISATAVALAATAALLLVGAICAVWYSVQSSDESGGEQLQGSRDSGVARVEPRPSSDPGAVSADSNRVLLVINSRDFWYGDFEPTRDTLTAAGFEVVVASSSTAAAIPEPRSEGRPVTPDIVFWDADPADYRAVVFTGASVSDYIGQQRATTRRFIEQLHERGGFVGSICLGTRVLAQTGLLDGKEASSTGLVANQISGEFSQVLWRTNQLQLDNRFLTCGNWRDASLFAQRLADELKNAE
jgi:serine/threonine-protein kinase